MKKFSASKSKANTHNRNKKQSVHPNLKGTTAQKSVAHKINVMPSAGDLHTKPDPKYSNNANPVGNKQ